MATTSTYTEKTKVLKTINIFLITFVISFALFHFGLTSSSQKYLPEIITAEAKLFPLSKDREPLRTTTANTVPKPKPTVLNEKIDFGFKLDIPTLNVSAPIVLESTTNQEKIYKQLENGVVHYASTPLPGESGTAIILGHSSHYPWYKGNYGYIFANLAKLKIGDTFKIEKDNQVLNYKVSRILIFSPENINNNELLSLEKTSGSSLVLMTCWPIGTNAKRVAIRADLI